MTRAEPQDPIVRQPTSMIAALISVLALILPQSALTQEPAQDPPATPPPAAEQSSDATQLDTIEVTGSRIKRTDYETASPIQILSREDIEKTGRPNIGEVLRGLSVDNQGTIPTSFTAGFAAGSSAVSLRGLGVNSTLVLVNGRRMATYGLADDGSRTFVDLNSIPLEAVERVEVLKDGASALYGSDAIGGVVNIILRKNYEGASLGMSQGASQRWDGNLSRYFGSVGFGNMQRDGWNGFLTFESYSSNAIGNSDRDGYLATNDLRSYGLFDNRNGGIIAGGAGFFTGNSPYGTVLDSSGAFHNITGQSDSIAPLPPTTTATVDCPEIGPSGLCVWDPIAFEQIQPDEDRLNFMGRGVFALGPVRLYTELSQWQTEIFSLGTPGSWTFGGTYNPNDPTDPVFPTFRATLNADHPDNPTNPAGQGRDFGDGNVPYSFRYLGADGGGRNQLTESTVRRYLVGVEGDTEVWNNAVMSFDVGLMHVKSELDNTNYGFAHRSGVLAWLNGVGGADPATSYRVNQPTENSAQMMYDIYHPDTTHSTSEVTLLDGHVVLPLAQLAGGPLTVVLGAEQRNEKTNSPPVPGTDTGEVAGLGYSAFNSDRDVTAVYVELGAPVLDALELTGAVRFDKYSDYGNSTTPKLGVKYKPIDELAVRATYSESFRAPGPTESGNSASLGFTNIAIISTGDPSVQPETAKSWTVGFVAEPMDGTNVAVDYYLIQREDEIVQADQAAIIGSAPLCSAVNDVQPGAQPNSFIYYNDTAASSGPCAPAQAGIQAVSGPYANANETETSGIDLDFRHRWDVADVGKVGFGVIWTHLINFERTVAGVTYDYTGTHGPFVLSSAGGTPEDRAVLSLNLERGAWNTTLNANYFGSMKLIDHEGESLTSNGDGTYQTTTGEGTYVVNPGEQVCGVYNANGTAFNDCKLDSWTTFDFVTKFAANQQWTATLAISNLFDKDAPLDPYTYGGVNYHPANYQDGAVGRFFTVGLKYDFQ